MPSQHPEETGYGSGGKEPKPAGLRRNGCNQSRTPLLPIAPESWSYNGPRTSAQSRARRPMLPASPGDRIKE